MQHWELAAARGADERCSPLRLGKITDAQRLGARNSVLYTDEVAMRTLRDDAAAIPNRANSA
jgi:hypothetical protein